LSFLLWGVSEYDKWQGNAAPDLELDVVSGGKMLLNGTFTSPTDPPAFSALFFEDIPNEGVVKFVADGKGQASVVFGASFVPAQINTQPINRGIQVQKIIQLLDPETNLPFGPPITSAVIGERVVVTIQITIPDYSSSITISDSFPGAIQPLDDNIYDDIAQSSPPTPPVVWDYWWFYFYEAFAITEFLEDRVVFYGQQLFAGTHTVSYTALVNTEGEFVLPPAQAYDAMQPEVMGLSAGGVFTTFSEMPNITVTPTTNVCLYWQARATQRQSLSVLTPRDLFTDTDMPPSASTPPAVPLAWWVPLVVVLAVLGAAGIIVGIVFAVKYAIAPVAQDSVTTELGVLDSVPDT